MALLEVFFTLLWLSALSEAHNFTADFLKTVNQYRKNHKAGSLILDSKLSEKAQQLANAIAKDGNFSKPTEPGENTFMLCTNYNRALRAKEAVKAWYDEVCSKEMDFEFKNTTVGKTLSFTQLVWKNSKSVGVGRKSRRVKSLDGEDTICTYVVALFNPPGNIEEPIQYLSAKGRYIHFSENVNPANNTAEYCKKILQEKKRRKRSSILGKSHLHNHVQKFITRNPERRSLYYKVPAKFYIDPETGMTKAISPAGIAPQVGSKLQTITSNPYSRSLYPSLPYSQPLVMSYPTYPEIMAPSVPFTYPYQGLSYAQRPEIMSSFYSQPLQSYPMESNFVSQVPLPINPIKKDTDIFPDIWQQVALRVHNKLRVEIHQTPVLTWNTELAAEAENQAQQNANLGNLQHSLNLGDIGENLAYNCLQKEVAPVEESISDWYGEICNTSVKFPIKSSNSKDVLHFSQVLWASTKFLGCGRAVVDKTLINDSVVKCTYYCCRYSSGRNIDSEFEANVNKGNFDRERTCHNLPKIITEAKESPIGIIFMGEDVKQGLRMKALQSHNYYRTIHDTRPLRLDDDLNDKANSWALEVAREGKLKHSNIAGGSYGENLWFKCTSGYSNVSDAEFVKDWYDEVCHPAIYNFKKKEKQRETLHFTQVVWEQSNKLGIGIVATETNGQYCTYVVARYAPRGNTENKFQENVKEGFFNNKTCLKQKTKQEEEIKYPSDAKVLPVTEVKAPFSAEVKIPEESKLGAGEGKYALVNEAKVPTAVKDKTFVSAEGKTSEEGKLGDIFEEKISSNERKVEGKTLESKAPVKTKSEEQLQQAKQQDQDEKNYQDDFVTVMNNFRKMHLSQPVTSSLILGEQSKQAATQYVKGIHKVVAIPGEMVQVTCNPLDRVLPPEDAFSNWYNELCTKSYQFEKDNQTHLHATQLIWNETLEAGVAYATKKKSNSLCTLVVAKFFPPGNQPGKFLQNVKKGLFERSFCGSTNTIAIAALEGSESKNSAEMKIPIEAKQEPKVEDAKSLLESKLTMEESKFTQVSKSSLDSKFPQEPKSLLQSKLPQESSSSHESKLPQEFSHESKFPKEQKLPLEDSNLSLEFKHQKESKSPHSSKLQPESKVPIEESKLPLEKSKPPLVESKVPLAESKLPLEESKLPLIEPKIGIEELKSPLKESKSPSKSNSSLEETKSFLEESKSPHEESKSPQEESKSPQEESKASQEESKASLKESQSPLEESKSPLEESKSPLESKFPLESKSPMNLQGFNSSLESKIPQESKSLIEESKSLSESELPQDSKFSTDTIEPVKTESKAPEVPEESKMPSNNMPFQNPTPSSEGKSPDIVPVNPQNAQQLALGDESKSPDVNIGTENNLTNKDSKDPEVFKNSGNLSKSKELKNPGERPKSPGEELQGIKPKVELKKFNAEGLKAHNALRSLHGVPLLQYDDELAQKAFEIANSLGKADSKSQEKKDSVLLDFGFNVMKKCFSDAKPLPADEAVLNWWGDSFCVQNALETKLTSPGTQVIWKNTSKLGMGHAQSNVDGEYCNTVVALYIPKGNKQDEFQANVLAGDFDADVMCEDKNNTLQVAYDLLENSMENISNNSLPEDGSQLPSSQPESQSPSSKPESQPPSSQPESPSPSSQPESQPPSSQPESQPPSSQPESQSPSSQPELQLPSEEYEFARNALEAHNILRKIHGAPDLQLDDEMNEDASSYAYKIASKQSLQHASPLERKNDGENLAYRCTSGQSDYQPTLPVRDWYKEVCESLYSFNDSKSSSITGHFTQLIWKSSKKFGFGFATKKNGNMTCHYSVARYRPAGNMAGEYVSNVLKGSFLHSQTCDNLNKILQISPSKRSFTARLVRKEPLKKSLDSHLFQRSQIARKASKGKGVGAKLIDGLPMHAFYDRLSKKIGSVLPKNIFPPKKHSRRKG